MALIDQVQLRLSQDLLSKITNVDNPTNGTVNLVYLAQICADVLSLDFEAVLGETYLEANGYHNIIGTLLVKLKAIEYGAALDESADNLMSRMEKWAEKYRNVRSRDRVAPTSSSQLQPTPEVSGNSVNPKRPNFDDPFFDEMTPEATTEATDPLTGLPLP